MMNPLWEALARALTFRLLYERRNIGEVRAFLRAEVQLGLECPDSRGLFILDSQVSLGCISKGRSSLPSINREFERTLGNS